MRRLFYLYGRSVSKPRVCILITLGRLPCLAAKGICWYQPHYTQVFAASSPSVSRGEHLICSAAKEYISPGVYRGDLLRRTDPYDISIDLTPPTRSGFTVTKLSGGTKIFCFALYYISLLTLDCSKFR